MEILGEVPEDEMMASAQYTTSLVKELEREVSLGKGKPKRKANLFSSPFWKVGSFSSLTSTSPSMCGLTPGLRL